MVQAAQKGKTALNPVIRQKRWATPPDEPPGLTLRGQRRVSAGERNMSRCSMSIS